jgi:hypothetical protein
MTGHKIQLIEQLGHKAVSYHAKHDHYGAGLSHKLHGYMILKVL